MAKAITKYRADDGSEFATMEEAVAHDALCAQVASIVAMLYPTPKDCDFSNGAGFVRQTPSAVLGVQRALVKIARRFFSDDEMYERHFKHAELATIPVGYTFVGRLISDGCPDVVYRAWNRIMCTGEDFREWGQPYFANHPSEAKQADLTPKRVPSAGAVPK